jgi:hypothetical protein
MSRNGAKYIYKDVYVVENAVSTVTYKFLNEIFYKISAYLQHPSFDTQLFTA